MRPTRWIVLALALLAGAAQAQLSTPDPDWKEMEAPPPAALRTEGLVPIEIPQSNLRFGVDPASVQVGSDGIVRYVVVATSTSGAVNASYEGIRCNTGEGKVYARHRAGKGWVPNVGEQWQSLQQTRNSRHALVIARNGACLGSAPNRSASQIVRDLGGGVNWRFWNN